MRKTMKHIKTIALGCALIIFLSGCQNSYLSLYENYKIKIPENCEILRRCIFYIGVDSVKITELQYTEDSISELFPWKEMDEQTTKIIEQILSELNEAEENNQNLPDFEVVKIVTNKLPKVMYYDATLKPGMLCYLLLDLDENILYICENNT